MRKGKGIGAAIVAIFLGVFGGFALAILLSYLLRHKRGIELFFEKVRKGKTVWYVVGTVILCIILILTIYIIATRDIALPLFCFHFYGHT